jgi:hypothetical protein
MFSSDLERYLERLHNLIAMALAFQNLDVKIAAAQVPIASCAARVVSTLLTGSARGGWCRCWCATGVWQAYAAFLPMVPKRHWPSFVPLLEPTIGVSAWAGRSGFPSPPSMSARARMLLLSSC